MAIELGIFGAGNMAEAIAGGILRRSLLKSDQILAADVSPARRELFTGQFGIRTSQDNGEVARQAKAVLLSVKPQQMKDVLAAIAPVIQPDVLIISIAAGVSTRFIETHLGVGKNWHVIRMMPNTPMLVGEGIAALARGRHATAQDASDARTLFEGAATVVELEETKMDAVTALSGSGPAYLFYLVEQMIRAGTELGLSPEESRTLATKTCIGTAKMLAGSADSAAELRRKVTSPGGTTQAAISFFEQNQLAQTIVEAIKAAARRSRELGS